MTKELKNKIIEKINNTDNVNLLNAVFIVLNSSKENIENFIGQEKDFLKSKQLNQKNEDFNDREDFSSYIKEWVKSM